MSNPDRNIGQLRRGVDKAYRGIFDAAVDQGWRVARKRNYVAIYPPDKSHSPMMLPASGGSRNRGKENTIAALRRAGLKI